AVPDAPLNVTRATDDGWVLFSSGKTSIASFVAAVRDLGEVCFAFLAAPAQPKTFDFPLRVGFDEVNRMGTVNFQAYFNWQARAREAFLHQHAPGVMAALHQGLILVTTEAGCEYVDEISSQFEVIVRMTLLELGESSITMGFE